MAEPKKKSALRKALSRVYNKGYAVGARAFYLNNGKLMRGTQAGNDWLYKSLMDDKPFMMIRPGIEELGRFHMYDQNGGDPERISKLKLDWWDCDDLYYYGQRMEEAYAACDGICCWYVPKRGEAGLVKKYAPNAARVETGFLNFSSAYEINKPFWLEALKGKRVLVVTLFDREVLDQYEKRDKIFPDHLLPEFADLQTYKSVWFSRALDDHHDPRFKEWQEALEYQRNDIEKLDFDVALLACGTFGPHIQTTIKKMGKKSVYLGGDLQLYFGIRGKRWDNGFPELQRFYNDAWIRPYGEGPLGGAAFQDNGAYW